MREVENAMKNGLEQRCGGNFLAIFAGTVLGEKPNFSSYTAEKPTGGTTGATAPPYLVRVKITNLNIHKGPGTNYGATGYIQPGIYTIVAESTGKGATKWGKLKSGAGWISLDYTTKT